MASAAPPLKAELPLKSAHQDHLFTGFMVPHRFGAEFNAVLSDTELRWVRTDWFSTTKHNTPLTGIVVVRPCSTGILFREGLEVFNADGTSTKFAMTDEDRLKAYVAFRLRGCGWSRSRQLKRSRIDSCSMSCKVSAS
jgi:hypothetical protein